MTTAEVNPGALSGGMADQGVVAIEPVRPLDLNLHLVEPTVWSDPTPVPVVSVAIVGLGYVGLPTALSLLETGARVIGIDVDPSRLRAIQERRVDLIPTDQHRLARWLSAPEFALTLDVGRIGEADTVIICVPTPIDSHHLPDPGALRAACASVVANAYQGQTIILTSTTFVGSTRELVVEPLRALGLEPGRDIFVAFAPERIDPGNTHHRQETVPRVVGGYSPECTIRASEIVGRVAPVVRVSSPEVAELAKLYENTFRAVNIAMVNEFEAVSRKFGVDITEVIRAASTKPFGFMPFVPGTGVGGHCIPCDPHYLLWQLREMRFEAPLIQQAMTSIARRPADMVEWMVSELSDRGKGVRDARVLVVGVAYKPGVEDVRESPALEIIEALRDRGADVEYHDPLVPRITVAGEHVMSSSIAPNGADYDAILVHAIHPDAGYSWILDCEVVLDPGGRLRTAVQPPGVVSLF